MRIIGIDPGTAILGFGVIEKKSSKLSMLDAGVIRTASDQSDSKRLQTIYDELAEVIKHNKPDAMAIEKLFFAQNVTTAMTVSQARGAVMLCGEKHGLEVFEYTPLQIKQSITGYGRADKNQIQQMVKTILKLDSVPKPDDCADALACAITHAMTSHYA